MLRIRRLFTYKHLNFMQQESEWLSISHVIRPIDVPVHDKNSLTELIAMQTHPAVLMQIYEKHKFDMDHIILALKISISFHTDMRNLKPKEFALFQKMCAELDVKKLTLIDLRDALQCQAKFKQMGVQMLQDKHLILNAIKANVDKYELRNLVNIYYHTQQLNQHNEFLLEAIRKNIHLANSTEITLITKVEYLKFRQSKFAKWDVLKEIALRIEELIEVIDADQLAQLYSYFTQMELHYYSDYLQPLPIIFLLAQTLLNKIEQLDMINILQIVQSRRHQQKNFPDFLQRRIKKLLFQTIQNNESNLTIYFLMSFLENHEQLSFFTDEEEQIIKNLILKKIRLAMDDDPSISDVSSYARYLLFLEYKMDGFEQYQNSMDISILNYLKSICNVNLDQLIQERKIDYITENKLLYAHYQLLGDCDLKKQLYEEISQQSAVTQSMLIVHLEYIDDQYIPILEKAAPVYACYDSLVKYSYTATKSMISQNIVDIWKKQIRQEDYLWLMKREMQSPTKFHMDFLMHSLNRSLKRLAPKITLEIILFSPMVAIYMTQSLLNQFLIRFKEHSRSVRLTVLLFQYLKNNGVDYWKYRIPYNINIHTLEQMYPYVDDDCKLIILFLIFINP